MNKKQIGVLLASLCTVGLYSSGAAADHHDATKEKHLCQNNNCKGHAECMGYGNDACHGQNSCKGKGWVAAASEAECKKKSGIWHGDNGEKKKKTSNSKPKKS